MTIREQEMFDAHDWKATVERGSIRIRVPLGVDDAGLPTSTSKEIPLVRAQQLALELAAAVSTRNGAVWEADRLADYVRAFYEANPPMPESIMIARRDYLLARGISPVKP